MVKGVPKLRVLFDPVLRANTARTGLIFQELRSRVRIETKVGVASVSVRIPLVGHLWGDPVIE